LQFDVVEVSGANQYTVRPWALVSTVAPPIFAVFRADEPVLDDGAAADWLPEPAWLPVDVLPHAAAISATAARPAGAHHLLRIAFLRIQRKTIYSDHVAPGRSVHDGSQTPRQIR